MPFSRISAELVRELGEDELEVCEAMRQAMGNIAVDSSVND